MKIVLARQYSCTYGAMAHNILNERHEVYQLTKNIIEDKNFPKDYDLGISYLYTYKIPKGQLNKPWINFHPGPLPNYRGRNIIYHAIMNEEKEFGGTIHYMDEKFDTGDIIEVFKFPILESDTAGDILIKTRESLWTLFKKHIPNLLNGKTLPRQKQENGKYYLKSEINEEVFLTKEQKKQIRAISVFPNFYATVNIGGKIYKIIKK